jgi:diaminopimelate decarboxylase
MEGVGMADEASGQSVLAERDTWPSALTVSPAGHACLDGCDLVDVAAQFGTPTWVVSQSTIEENYDVLTDAFRSRYEDVEVAYSIKANNTLAVIRMLADRGALLDTSAEYEHQLALAAGCAPSAMIVNGNGKSEDALRFAATAGIRQVNVDSSQEALRLDEIAHAGGAGLVPCLVRVHPGYEQLLAQDPSFSGMVTVAEGKYGSHVDGGDVFDTIQAVLESRHLDFLGLHNHLGFSGYTADYSVGNELMHHREATREICELASEVARRFGIGIQRLDLGGGFRAGRAILLSTPRSGHDLAVHELPSPEAYAAAIFDTLEAFWDLPDLPLVQFEVGGYLVGNAVGLLTSVADVKDVKTSAHTKRYVTADASSMMFVSRLRQRLAYPVVSVASAHAEADPSWPVDIVGQTCFYDGITENVRLPALKKGDVLFLLHQGAYCEVQSTMFNAFPRPSVVLAAHGSTRVVKRRETIADVMARDVLPLGGRL